MKSAIVTRSQRLKIISTPHFPHIILIHRHLQRQFTCLCFNVPPMNRKSKKNRIFWIRTELVIVTYWGFVVILITVGDVEGVVKKKSWFGTIHRSINILSPHKRNKEKQEDENPQLRRRRRRRKGRQRAGSFCHDPLWVFFHAATT